MGLYLNYDKLVLVHVLYKSCMNEPYWFGGIQFHSILSLKLPIWFGTFVHLGDVIKQSLNQVFRPELCGKNPNEKISHKYDFLHPPNLPNSTMFFFPKYCLTRTGEHFSDVNKIISTSPAFSVRKKIKGG